MWPSESSWVDPYKAYKPKLMSNCSKLSTGLPGEVIAFIPSTFKSSTVKTWKNTCKSRLMEDSFLYLTLQKMAVTVKFFYLFIATIQMWRNILLHVHDWKNQIAPWMIQSLFFLVCSVHIKSSDKGRAHYCNHYAFHTILPWHGQSNLGHWSNDSDSHVCQCVNIASHYSDEEVSHW